MIELRQCLSSDIDEVRRLNKTVYEALDDKTLLRLNSDEMLQSCLRDPNFAMGAWDGKRLVAMGILFVPQTNDEDLSQYVEAGKAPSANQKLYLVDAEYRGRGLQRRLIRSVEKEASQRGYVMLCVTCAPHNTFSINNFLAEEYNYAATVKKYGGMLRNVYYKLLS